MPRISSSTRMSNAEYSEGCCFNDVRDHCPLNTQPCDCRCHEIQVTVHGRIGSGPVDVRTLDAFCRMVTLVHDMIEDGAFSEGAGMATRIVSGREWRQRAEAAEAKVSKLERLLARVYPFLTWPDDVRGADHALDAEFDGIVTDVQVAIQHLPDDKEH